MNKQEYVIGYFSDKIIHEGFELDITYVITEGVFVGWINDYDGCISQSESLEELKESLVNLLNCKLHYDTNDLLK